MFKSLSTILISSLLLYASSQRALVPIVDDYPDSQDEAVEIDSNIVINAKLDTSNDDDWFKLKTEFDSRIDLKVESNNSIALDLFCEYDYSSSSYSSASSSTGGGALPPIAKQYRTVNSYYYPTLTTTYNAFLGKYTASYSTSNSSSCTFYIRVNNNGSPASSYSFELNATILLDQSTLDYCKNHLKECGIKPLITIVPI